MEKGDKRKGLKNVKHKNWGLKKIRKTKNGEKYQGTEKKKRSNMGCDITAVLQKGHVLVCVTTALYTMCFGVELIEWDGKKKEWKEWDGNSISKTSAECSTSAKLKHVITYNLNSQFEKELNIHEGKICLRVWTAGGKHSYCKHPLMLVDRKKGFINIKPKIKHIHINFKVKV